MFDKIVYNVWAKLYKHSHYEQCDRVDFNNGFLWVHPGTEFSSCYTLDDVEDIQFNWTNYFMDPVWETPTNDYLEWCAEEQNRMDRVEKWLETIATTDPYALAIKLADSNY